MQSVDGKNMGAGVMSLKTSKELIRAIITLFIVYETLKKNAINNYNYHNLFLLHLLIIKLLFFCLKHK